MSTPNSKQLLVEKALLGELPEQAELPADAAQRLDELRLDNQAILDKYPAARVAKEIRRRHSEHKSPERRWAMILLPAAAAPLVLAAVLWGPRGKIDSAGQGTGGDDSTMVGVDTDVQLKGQGPDLRLYRRRDGTAPERLSDGSIVHPKEVLQLAYLAAGRGFGVIVSVDGRGNVELHHPRSPDEPPVLTRGGEQPLLRGYQLDDAPRFERFFLVTAKNPESLVVAQVVQAARLLASQPEADRAPLLVTGPVEIRSVTVRKEAP